MPKPYPREFRDDVVRVVGRREPGVTVKQVAKDLKVHPLTLFKWLVDEGAAPGVTRSELAELREARQRIRLLEQVVCPGSAESGYWCLGHGDRCSGFEL